MDLPEHSDDPKKLADEIEEIDRKVRELCTPEYLAVKKQQIMDAVLDEKIKAANDDLIAALDAVTDTEADLAAIHAKFPLRTYVVNLKFPIESFGGVDVTVELKLSAHTLAEACRKAEDEAVPLYEGSRVSLISETQAASGSA